MESPIVDPGENDPKFDQHFRVQVSGLDGARKGLMTELKAQLVECQVELDQMREDKASIVEHQNIKR